MCSNNNIFNSAEYLPKFADTGTAHCRVDAGFNITRKNAGDDPQKWDWSHMEKVRQAAQKYPRISFLPILGYGAKWAAASGYAGNDIAVPPRGINAPVTSPENLFGNYVYETVSRYKDSVHCWESWNEPDLPGHVFFAGNGHDFVPYQRACYLAAKKADPRCTVVFAGLCYANIEGYMYSRHLKPPTFDPSHTSFFEEYLQTVVKDPQAKANNFYFDVMNQHSYSRASDLSDYAQIQNKLMTEYLGQTKPIWFTETGFGDKGGPFGGTPDDYCDYLLQTFCWSKQAKIQSQFHFQLDNSNELGLYDGMLGKAKPALQTYKMMTRELADAQFVAQLHGNAGVGFIKGNSPFSPSAWQTGYNLFELKNAAGKTIFIAFTDTNKPVDIKIPAKHQNAVLIDRHGEKKNISAVNGSYSIRLPGATNLAGFPVLTDPKARALGSPEHLVGGATQIVVEE
ncbi:MAG TPA: hypothetical protein V6C76_14600 [Drouetiella sp.]